MLGHLGPMLQFALANSPRSAKVAELADAPDLGSGGETRGGSSPPFRTTPSNPLIRPNGLQLAFCGTRHAAARFLGLSRIDRLFGGWNTANANDDYPVETCPTRIKRRSHEQRFQLRS